MNWKLVIGVKRLLGLPVIDWSKINFRDMNHALGLGYCYLPKPGLDEGQLPADFDPDTRPDLFLKHKLTQADRHAIQRLVRPRK